MNIEKLFEIQKALDAKILENHNLQSTDLVPPKILALQVELGELANETRCFKFWSLKKASPREVILEEYVDGLHFILSIGIDKQYEEVELVSRDVMMSQLESFSLLYDLISSFSGEQSKNRYQGLFQAYLDLGHVLGFSWSEIEEAYLEKNKVNHERQAQGY
jgi:dimeric dUTPase (all-alpha-NTP-PPase superfamily)